MQGNTVESEQKNTLAAFGPEGHGNAAHVRNVIRQGLWTQHTSGLAHGHVQGNLVILPEALAGDFLRFCQRNPKPCPVLAVGEPGQPALPSLGDGIDIRSDVPLYRVWRHGELKEEVSDITPLWRDDLVTFVLGCSFSFEHALQEAGIRLRHIDENRNVAMYRTSIATEPAGPFSGAMVVSMRPMPAADVIRAVQVTSRFPNVHGAPVHIGDPSLIGIKDLGQPDYGDPVDLAPGDIPVFWACGVTPQSAILTAQPAFCITHAPGAMLVTSLLNQQLASF